MDSLLVLIGIILAIALGSAWLYRRRREVDDYYEREYKDPPITDITSGSGGGWGR